jgi:hypothetical protein
MTADEPEVWMEQSRVEQIQQCDRRLFRFVGVRCGCIGGAFKR